MQLWLFWVIVGVVLIIAEMSTFTFYLLWLGVGALVGAVVSRFTDSWFLQLIIAAIAALILTVATRPLTRNIRHSSVGFFDPHDKIVGQKGAVEETITPQQMGQVRVGSDVWSATADEEIGKGETVTVTDRGSTIIHVVKFTEEA